MGMWWTELLPPQNQLLSGVQLGYLLLLEEGAGPVGLCNLANY